ncbi:MAG: 1-deoxy-D-xylulose-5-phosphate reductoisomerase, partial [Nonomuraea sp.]|nr:1-deoxy-D-xylulose-5-phosphate reductoisomerase [Nonomuraea sp.]
MHAETLRSVVVLGSTGSIGTQALDVIAANPDGFRVAGLAAGGGRVEELAAQAAASGAEVVAVADASAVPALKEALGARGVSPVVLGGH